MRVRACAGRTPAQERVWTRPVRGERVHPGRSGISVDSEQVRCPGGFVQTCLPLSSACRAPRLHEVTSDALSWSSSKLNN